MIRPIHALAVALVAAAIAFAGGAAEARVHHRHHAAAEPAMVCGRHHRHCHPAKTTTATAQVCDRHHRHCHPAKATTATALVCDRHHRRCHPAATATAQVCDRHHRHCHPATGAGGKVVCGRHHRHCHAVVETRRRRHVASVAAPPADTGGDNGMCKSVRIHGEWVQRCHFPGQ